MVVVVGGRVGGWRPPFQAPNAIFNLISQQSELEFVKVVIVVNNINVMVNAKGPRENDEIKNRVLLSCP